jgi:hypothetical protein
MIRSHELTSNIPAKAAIGHGRHNLSISTKKKTEEDRRIDELRLAALLCLIADVIWGRVFMRGKERGRDENGTDEVRRVRLCGGCLLPIRCATAAESCCSSPSPNSRSISSGAAPCEQQLHSSTLHLDEGFSGTDRQI